MSNKLLVSDITDLLAENTQISKKDAGAFLKTLFELVEEQLLIDKIVKIKGLGTFKLIWVESRRIANVNTGEIQEISGHYKPTFTPDMSLAEAVNEPFAHLETVDLDDCPITDQPLESEGVKPKPRTIVEEKPQHTATEEETPQIAYKSEATKEPEVVVPEIPALESEPEPKKRSFKALFFVIIVALLAVAGYYGYEFVENNQPKQSQKVASDSVKNVVKDTLAVQSDSAKTKISSTPIVPESKDSILTTEMLEAGSRLTRIAQKYYGNKVFWVYLYQANRYVIRNPNVVTAGTVIEIPNARIYNIDANDPQSIARAKALESEIWNNLQ